MGPLATAPVPGKGPALSRSSASPAPNSCPKALLKCQFGDSTRHVWNGTHKPPLGNVKNKADPQWGSLLDWPLWAVSRDMSQKPRMTPVTNAQREVPLTQPLLITALCTSPVKPNAGCATGGRGHPVAKRQSAPGSGLGVAQKTSQKRRKTLLLMLKLGKQSNQSEM